MKKSTTYPKLIVQAIDAYRLAHPYGPSYREIGEAVGLQLHNVRRYLYKYNGVLWSFEKNTAHSIRTIPQPPESETE